MGTASTILVVEDDRNVVELCRLYPVLVDDRQVGAMSINPETGPPGLAAPTASNVVSAVNESLIWTGIAAAVLGTLLMALLSGACCPRYRTSGLPPFAWAGATSANERRRRDPKKSNGLPPASTPWHPTWRRRSSTGGLCQDLLIRPRGQGSPVKRVLSSWVFAFSGCIIRHPYF